MFQARQGLVAQGEHLRSFAMPLGGIGTGNLSICGDGSLRQWQVGNTINHIGYVPFALFGIYWQSDFGRDARLLQSADFLREPDFKPLSTSSDHYIPNPLKRWAIDLPTVDAIEATGAYPAARLQYQIEAAPLEIAMTAWSPFVPLDSERSGFPVAIFEFEIRNRVDYNVHARLLSTLPNFVGWDGKTPLTNLEHPQFGANLNLRQRFGDADGVLMTKPNLPPDHPALGELALFGIGGETTILENWTSLPALWQDFADKGVLSAPLHFGPSNPGATFATARLQAQELLPGDSTRFTVAIAWRFPNRYVDWEQWPPLIPNDKSRFYLGNHYAQRGDLPTIVNVVLKDLDALRQETGRYVEAFYDQTLPTPAVHAAGFGLANLRTNVCIRPEDGRFHGFEGGHGASTWEGFHGTGGSCPMNCTHVWNYEQALGQFFPGLFQSMRETDWRINQHATGYLPHRTPLPLYLPRLWDVTIFGPNRPALDGLFAAILKTYQHYETVGDTEWLRSVWPHVTRALDYVARELDPEGEGVMHGEQPNTYDIHLYGPNTFVGSQYLAALQAAERLALYLGEPEMAEDCCARFERGRVAYDRICFDGEHYVQRIPDGCEASHQFGFGCCTDQLLGEWWASHLGLDPIFPAEHVHTALRTIFRRNYRHDFVGFVQTPRVFAAEHDRGLLNATYREGERPKVPLLYSDEVWPGVEYAYAALCLHFGLTEEAWTVVNAVRDRYDGRYRSPFNEVECGDHYIRSLSAWSLLPALHGVRYSAPQRRLDLSGLWAHAPLTAYVPLGTAHLKVEATPGAAEITVLFGSLAIEDQTYSAGDEISIRAPSAR